VSGGTVTSIPGHGRRSVDGGRYYFRGPAWAARHQCRRAFKVYPEGSSRFFRETQIPGPHVPGPELRRKYHPGGRGGSPETWWSSTKPDEPGAHRIHGCEFKKQNCSTPARRTLAAAQGDGDIALVACLGVHRRPDQRWCGQPAPTGINHQIRMPRPRLPRIKAASRRHVGLRTAGIVEYSWSLEGSG